MMATAGLYPPAVHAMANHVTNCLKAHRTRLSAQFTCPPLFVGVQGPQGSGKTFLTSRLRALLAGPPYSLSVAVLSIDDLYLPHAGLTALAEAHPQNRLLRGRGQPGTHDAALGRAILFGLKAINNGAGEVSLPVFDKSMFDGAGDRAAETRAVRPPIDVVVLEGWCVGFYPVPRAVVEARWARAAVSGRGGEEGVGTGGGFDLHAQATLEDVLEVNTMLRAYVAWWQILDAFVQVRIRCVALSDAGRR